MSITKRQWIILEIVIREYIDLAEPVSSRHIEENYELGVSPATIRNDLKKLVEEGYLEQPHSSAGRVPSDKGYRYFVNKILGKRPPPRQQIKEKVQRMERRMKDEIRFLRELTCLLAGLSSSLTYSYLTDKDLYWKEGFEETLLYPEFEDIERLHSFLDLTKKFEKQLQKRFSNKIENNEIKVYIGKENPFQIKDFSILISKCRLSKDRQAIVALLGPKRMAYDKNISLINSLVKLLEDGYGKEKNTGRKKEGGEK